MFKLQEKNQNQNWTMGHTSVNGPGYSVDVTTDYIETLVIGCIVSDF